MKLLRGPVVDRRRVFVVHGRDGVVRDRMFDFLRALDLKPMEWESCVMTTDNVTPFLGEVPPSALAEAQAVVVLLTPDDVVHLHPRLHVKREVAYEMEETCQPRPNVLIELGMALAVSPRRTILVEMGDLRPISDIGGRNVIHLDGSPATMGKLVERLKSAGCAVDDRGGDWRDPQRFARLDAYDRRPAKRP
ncbi:TIR domain-containing protein [Herbidospora mongoliensis]|uniref:TIR domain-containing protein n=1 Tax=Herbidospora mongoliensis TaxID=688067 RepID=UPI001C3F3003|nr:nucleotide-binding protein [Herbidospora mongoliensis]